MTDDGRTGFDDDLEMGPLPRRSSEGSENSSTSQRSTVGLEDSSNGELYAAVPEGESDWRVLRWAKDTREWVSANKANSVLGVKIVATLLNGGSKLVKAHVSPAAGSAMAQTGSVLGMAGNAVNLYRFATSARQTGSWGDALKAVSEAAGMAGGVLSNVVMPNTGLSEHAQVPGVTAGTSVQSATALVTLGDTEAEKLAKAQGSLGQHGYAQHPNRPLNLLDLQPVDVAGRTSSQPPGWNPTASAALVSAAASAPSSPPSSPAEASPLAFSPAVAATPPTGRRAVVLGDQTASPEREPSPDQRPPQSQSVPDLPAWLTQRASSVAYGRTPEGLTPRRGYTTTDLPSIPAGQTLPPGSRSTGTDRGGADSASRPPASRAWSANDHKTIAPGRRRGGGGK